MLQIKNLSITHKKDLRPLLDHFTFSLNSGDKAVIFHTRFREKGFDTDETPLCLHHRSVERE